MINRERSERISDFQVQLYRNDEGCYGVCFMKYDKDNLNTIMDWSFGSKPFDEVVSHYWYNQAKKMLQNGKEYREEIRPLLIKYSDPEKIKAMCKKAVEFATL